MKHAFVHQIDTFVKENELLHPGAVVVAAVSGGPDSLALLHYLYRSQERHGIQVIAAHVDHMFRGEESHEDLLYVQRVCEEWGIACEAAKIDVLAYQKEHQLGAQAAARECRYAFLKEVMDKHHAHYLALGHHGDDQIETILMRMTRGSTPQGYAGIAVKRPFAEGYIIRPFLAAAKQELEQYCEEMNLNPRIDPSNAKDTYTRNRFRRHILPYLKRENPAVHERFQQFSKFLQEDEAYLQELASGKMNKVVKTKNRNCVVLSVPLLESIAVPLQRRVIQLILNYLYEHKLPSSLSSIHIDQVLNLLAGSRPSGTLHFPGGLHVVRTYEECSFSFLKEEASPFSYILEVPGTVILPNGDELKAEISSMIPSGRNACIFAASSRLVSLPLTVRSRKDGDRMTVKGMNGTKKLKAIFIEAKVPKLMREQWPVVCDAEGTIVWLPRLKRSHLAVQPDEADGGSYILIHYKSKESSRRMDN
ncbi:tRNA lysidine(34) synthetase TilS [Ectobacillus ponti]|uniref:tRNA(Ile)-lysidine synthase n=1 Tax=Ectobacillus ponti TaxID=2961894 RepID=A0AA41XE06_9BACI|nr:tRNA lysidine(34) synthetase TilS [Ectobacillus ponti]MCP8971168.1 tRNA lysidine(34) synthetase TilS [Ectobacillus ponti]